MSVRPCRGPAHRGTDPPIVAAGWCDACSQWLAGTLDPGHPLGLMWIYVALNRALEPGTHGGHEKVRGSKSPPMPIDGHIDALLAQFENVVDSWARVVRTAARLTERDWLPMSEALQTLHVHQNTLVTLGPQPMTRHRPVAELVDLADDTPGRTMVDGRAAVVIIDLDGIDGALELLALRQAAKRALGYSKPAKYIGDCPVIFDDGQVCGQRLYADPYDFAPDFIVCGQCGASWDRRRWLILGASIGQGGTA